MPVYFLSEDENGCSPIKIGIARNIEVRKRNLQNGNPFELRLLGWIDTADVFEVEPRLLQRFAALRVRDE
jgi:hypothetical protein